MYDLMEASFDYQINAVFERFNDSMDIIILEFENTSDIYTEAEGERGGLVGFILKILETLKNLFNGAIKTIKSLLFGSKVDESKANEQVNLTRDPKALARITDDEFFSAKKLMKDLKDGKAGVEDVKDFIGKSENKLKGVKSVALSAATVFGIAKLNEKFLDKWKKECDEMYDQLKAEGSNDFAHKYAKSKYAENKASTAKEGATLLCNYMKDISKDGVAGAITNPLKKLYQMKYLQNKITDEGEALTSKKGFRALKREEKRKVKETYKAANDTLKMADMRDENASELKKLSKWKRRAKKAQKMADKVSYNDTK